MVQGRLGIWKGTRAGGNFLTYSPAPSLYDSITVELPARLIALMNLSASIAKFVFSAIVYLVTPATRLTLPWPNNKSFC